MNRIILQTQRITSHTQTKQSSSITKPQNTISEFQNLNKTIKLPNTHFAIENLLGSTAGQRPYREDGIRMDKQTFLNKTIYHNYGHGGGGLSVGYGCAYQVIDKLFTPEKVALSEPVAVIGAGIIGLTTAYLLAEKGYQVNVYAQIYPYQQELGVPELTTTVAGGYWMPLKMGHKEQTKRVAQLTWDHYHQVMNEQKKTGKLLGITKMPTYCVNDDEGLTYFAIEGVIQPKRIKVAFEDGVEREAITFDSLVIESRKYLPYLFDKMKKSGKVSYYKQLLTKQLIEKKSQKHLFNCCGFGGSSLIGDKSYNKGIKGHVMAFKLNKQPEVSSYILFLKTKEGRWLLQIPHPQSQRLVLGISYEQGKKDSFLEPEQVTKILTTAQQFYKQVSKKK